VAACPSPHGMVLELQASSTMILLDRVVMMCFRIVVFSCYLGLDEWRVLPLVVHFTPAAGSAGCCGAASSSLSQMTELLESS
jgi:hypothetical protein